MKKDYGRFEIPQSRASKAIELIVIAITGATLGLLIATGLWAFWP